MWWDLVVRGEFSHVVVISAMSMVEAVKNGKRCLVCSSSAVGISIVVDSRIFSTLKGLGFLGGQRHVCGRMLLGGQVLC